MKLLRWALAGASVYVVYKYTIGKQTQGEDVFVAAAGEEGAGTAPARRSAGRPSDASRLRR